MSDTLSGALYSKYGLPILEALHAKRREIVKELAPLELLFGSGGDRWTATRRMHRDGIAKLILAEAGTDIPQGRLEMLANGDPRHVAFVETTEKKFVRYFMLRTMLAEVEETIAHREVDARIVRAEMGLDH